MNEKLNYISDAELEQLILQVEREELVAAPPDLMENILEIVGLDGETPKEPAQSSEAVVTKVVPVTPRASRKKEFYSYCFRVITSVAAAVALVFILPELSALMQRTDASPAWQRQEVPSPEEVVDAVPSREEVVLAMQTPTRDEVLNGTGFIERVLNNAGWLNKQSSEE